MKKKALIKIFKHVGHLGFYLSVAFLFFVLLVLLAYNNIDLPTIDDGYLQNEVRKISNDQSFILHFNQSMNKKSVENSFSIYPNISGKFNWIDNKTLEFDTNENLEIGSLYTISISSEAKSVYKKAFSTKYDIQFLISGPPVVKFIYPFLYKTEDNLNNQEKDNLNNQEKDEILTIDKNQIITVMFDRPMRSLSNISNEDNIPHLDIKPAVKGKYKWIGTSSFQFIPDEWIMGTVYDITLPANIKSINGGATEEKISWKLQTDSLKVIKSLPINNYSVARVNEAISLYFNQEVDIDSIKPSENVQIFPSNDKDANLDLKNDGFFNTEVSYGKDEDGNLDKSILVFKPEFDYLYNQNYQLIFKKGLKPLSKGSEYGNRVMEDDYIMNFKTVDKPSILSISPTNETKDYNVSSIYINFSSPMKDEEVLKHIKISPELKEPEIYLHDHGKNVELFYDFKPSTEYTFEFTGPFLDEYGNKSKDSISTKFKTIKSIPYFNLMNKNTRFGLFMNYLKPIYSIKSVNLKSLDLKVCPISSNFNNLIFSYNLNSFHCLNSIKASVDISSSLDEVHMNYLDLNKIFNKDFNDGMYYLSMSSPEYLDHYGNKIKKSSLFLISDTAITIKKSQEDLLVYASDLKTSDPVSRMDITVISKDGKELSRGVTDGNGVYKITKELDGQFYVLGTKNVDSEKRWTLSSPYFSSGIESWRYDTEGEWITNGEDRIYLFTDRPIYKSSDEIFFKGLYRKDLDAKLRINYDVDKIKVVLVDPEYNEIQSIKVDLLTDGSFNGSFKLSDNPSLGSYNIYAEILNENTNPRFYHNFFVEEYKKPSFKIDFLNYKDNLLVGDKINTDIKASYYFGGDLKDAKMNWTLLKEPYYFSDYKSSKYFSFQDYDDCLYCESDINIVSEGEESLDSNSMFHLSLKDPDENLDRSYIYTINTEIENSDSDFVSSSKSFIAHQEDFYIGLHSDNFILENGNNLDLNIIAVSKDAKLLDPKKVDLEIYKEEWSTIKKQGVDGDFYDESVKNLKLVKSYSTYSTDEDKIYSIPIDDNFESGLYIVKAKSGKAVSSLHFYVSSLAWSNWGNFNNSQMELVSDKDEYFVGGKARILIKSPYGTVDNPAKALVTYERQGINHYELIDIKSNSTVLDVIITEDMIPNIYISVMVFKNISEDLDKYIRYQNSYLEPSIELDSLNKKISDINKDIISIKNDEKINENRANILISDKKNEIASLEKKKLSIKNDLGSVEDFSNLNVDLINPDFKLGLINLNINKREKEINVDIKTNKKTYNFGDKVEVELRTKDYKNNPIKSVVSLAIVDTSLLALKANTKESPLDYFYVNRALAVDTSSNLTTYVNRLDLNTSKGSKGGSGGLDETFDKKRGDFKDTAYFNPLIETDDAGFAKISFMPPSNLTTWEVSAVANAGEEYFGMGKSDFVVNKDYSLSSVIPSFAISGDKLRISAIFHNLTKDDIKTYIDLNSDGLDIKGKTKKNIFVNGDSEVQVDWDVEVKKVMQDSIINLEFESPYDTLIKSIKVKPFAFPETVATNGLVESKATESLRIENNDLDDMSYVKVLVSATKALTFLNKLIDLKDYPYNCAEQISSKILPLIILSSDDMENIRNASYKITNTDDDINKEYIQNYLQNLSKFQNYNGAYSYWPSSDYDDFELSSYILYVQGLARKNNFVVSDNDFNLLIKYMWKTLNKLDKNNTISLDNRAFALWVLSENSEYDLGMTLSLFKERENLSLYAKSMLLMNLDNLYKASNTTVLSSIDKLKSEIVNKEIVNDRQIHFEEENNTYGLSSNNRTTALVFMALNRNNPDNPILENILNYLLEANSIKRNFLNTQETAWILNAVFEYLKDHESLDVDYKYNIDFNSKNILSGKINEDNLFENFSVQKSISELNLDNNFGKIKFKKDGKGDLFYDIEYKYYKDNKDIPELERGIQINRTYFDFNSNKEVVNKSFKKSNIYRVDLDLIIPSDMYNVVVEENLPAGFEAINFNLDTSNKVLEMKLENGSNNPYYNNPIWRFNHIEMRNDKVLLFSNYLPKGVYKYSFLTRANIAGTYNHLPAISYQMYHPEVFGRTNGEIVEVK